MIGLAFILWYAHITLQHEYVPGFFVVPTLKLARLEETIALVHLSQAPKLWWTSVPVENGASIVVLSSRSAAISSISPEELQSSEDRAQCHRVKVSDGTKQDF